MTLKHPKSWILTTSQDYQPGRALSLGRILLDPVDPASALIPPDRTVKLPTIPKAARDSTQKRLVNIEHSDALNTSFKAWLDLNAGSTAGLAAQGTTNTATLAKTRWKIDTLAADMFIPSLAYAKAVLKSDEVAEYTKWWQQRRRVFIVTGVRIAKGASVAMQDSDSHGASGALQGHGKDPNTSMGGESGAAYSKEKQSTHAMSAGSMSDFVFAYRLHEIRYRVWMSPPEAYTHGEVSAARPENVDAGREVSRHEFGSFEVDAVEEEPVDPSAFVLDDSEEQDPRFVD
ncbi:hypothetical protein LIA77_01979 [Sarocladium implicatum]|nr:hypothetical protein LIA77_01979 [Sarocladium implicatum]